MHAFRKELNINYVLNTEKVSKGVQREEGLSGETPSGELLSFTWDFQKLSKALFLGKHLGGKNFPPTLKLSHKQEANLKVGVFRFPRIVGRRSCC